MASKLIIAIINIIPDKIPNLLIPALFTKIWIVPNFSLIVSKAAKISSSLLTSPFNGIISPLTLLKM